MKLTSILVLTALAASAANAQDVADIVKHIDERDEGNTSQARMVMVLEDKRGNQRVRNLQSYGKIYDDKESLSIYFLSPAEVKGSAFLSEDNNDEALEDNAWLYLPAINKVKRVAQTNQSDSFMGSDFSYSDITGTSVQDWDFTLLSESEMVGNQDCWLLESVPKAEKRQKILGETGYEKRRIWVSKDNYFIVRGQFFLAKGNKVKLMQADGIEQVDGIWMARSITMATTKNKKVLHKSTIEFTDVRYNESVPDSLFTTSALSSGPLL